MIVDDDALGTHPVEGVAQEVRQDAHVPAGQKVQSIPAQELRVVARIDPAFLEEELSAIGDRWYRQEYECSFEDVVGCLFRQEDIEAAFACDGGPLFGA